MVTSDIGSDSVVWPIPDTDPFTLIPWLIPDVSRTPVNDKHRSSTWSPADSWTAGFKPWTANDCDISISYTPITTTRQFKLFPPLPPHPHPHPLPRLSPAASVGDALLLVKKKLFIDHKHQCVCVLFFYYWCGQRKTGERTEGMEGGGGRGCSGQLEARTLVSPARSPIQMGP